jgi:tetratricopeptide (TPR) repeat protein
VATLRCSMSRPTFALVLSALFAPLAAAAEQAAPDASAMRLPSWIETLREGDTSTQPADVVLAGGSNAAAGETASSTDSSAIRTIADWTDPKPPSPAAAAIMPTNDERPAPAPTAPMGSFRRWVTERVASLPKPTTLLPTREPDAGPDPVPAAAEPEPEPEPRPAAPAQVTAPVAATPDEMPTLSVDPASFRGALPGKTSRAELEQTWGPPESASEGDAAEVAAWKIEPFDRVEVAFDGATVASISIKLVEPMAVADLARQLEIADLRTVPVRDEQGVEIGEVYPERGVILSVDPESRQGTAILIEPLDPDAFVLRAEQELDACSAYAQADLEYAVKIDPEHGRAHRMLLAMATDQGHWTQALGLAETASRLEPDSFWVRLKQAAVLLAFDRAAEARLVLDELVNRPELPPVLAAQTYRLIGRAALAGKAPDHRAAVEAFTESIRRAAPLLTKRGPAIQAATREILLDAHLGTALAIAEGTWQQKSRVIPKWIVRAETLVKEFQGDDRERQILELQLCRGALAASAGSTESIEPLPWVKRLLEVRDTLDDSVTDPWRRRQLDWEVGQGLADALTAAQIRGDAADMLDNATLTAAYLERGAEQRELTDEERKDVGDLMFRIGILHSLQRGDHATAVTWFDRAVPLWNGNERFARDGELGRLGESYVSMAISYWQVERREDAFELSRRGVDLMVSAVDAGQLEERALAVAYGNLATMHAEQGNEEQSRNYAEMAGRAEASGGVLR